MDCLVLPAVSKLTRCYTGSREGYQRLGAEDGFGELDGPVTVVVGKERTEFVVEGFVLEESPFRVLMETVLLNGSEGLGLGMIMESVRRERRVNLVDVDAILFEHMLWLMRNDTSSLFRLNIREVIDFYSQDS